MDVAALGPHRLRNVSEPRLGVCAASDTVDPVCRMRVDREHAAGSLRNQVEEYWFCSLACVGAFAAEPARYLAHENPGG